MGSEVLGPCHGGIPNSFQGLRQTGNAGGEQVELLGWSAVGKFLAGCA